VSLLCCGSILFISAMPEPLPYWYIDLLYRGDDLYIEYSFCWNLFFVGYGYSYTWICCGKFWHSVSCLFSFPFDDYDDTGVVPVLCTLFPILQLLFLWWPNAFCSLIHLIPFSSVVTLIPMMFSWYDGSYIFDALLHSTFVWCILVHYWWLSVFCWCILFVCHFVRWRWRVAWYYSIHDTIHWYILMIRPFIRWLCVSVTFVTGSPSFLHSVDSFIRSHCVMWYHLEIILFCDICDIPLMLHSFRVHSSDVILLLIHWYWWWWLDSDTLFSFLLYISSLPMEVMEVYIRHFCCDGIVLYYSHCDDSMCSVLTFGKSVVRCILMICYVTFVDGSDSLLFIWYNSVPVSGMIQWTLMMTFYYSIGVRYWHRDDVSYSV